jgi:hypothetical protein
VFENSSGKELPVLQVREVRFPYYVGVEDQQKASVLTAAGVRPFNDPLQIFEALSRA